MTTTSFIPGDRVRLRPNLDLELADYTRDRNDGEILHLRRNLSDNGWVYQVNWYSDGAIYLYDEEQLELCRWDREELQDFLSYDA